jgi:beta-carotene 3-hydroxylase
MELWAAMLHGRVWHGLLWRVHRSHHRPRRLGERWEANDALSVLHAPIAIALILYGCVGPQGFLREAAFGVGLGMTAFGFAYLVVHDGLVHGRLPVQWLLRIRYFANVRDAHLAHHERRHDVPPFGLFFGPWELARARRSSKAASAPRRGPKARAFHRKPAAWENTEPAQRSEATGPMPASTSRKTAGRFRAVSRTNR